jgi:SAM-dependent methyltransferase
VSERSGDTYEGLSYRDLIDWRRRLAREFPFLERELAAAPEKSVLDLGCGPGEHARRFAALGFRTLGVDRSPEMLAKAREGEAPPRLVFREGDLVRLRDFVPERFGGAVCLGNMLPSLEDEDALGAVFRGVASRLLPRGIFIVQILNYERILSGRIRSLPLRIRPSDDGSLVFLRFMEPEAGGRVRFYPTVLRWRPDGDPPVEVVESRAVRLRGWREPEVSTALLAAGFTSIRLYGDMTGGGYDAVDSSDLVAVARMPAEE